ncbi:MAG TPA: hypothetical protein VFX74_09735 [Candidatus Limnocylindria bacterium]|jgi:hypothetical protein|nr:hypothetical protein [Candidatus Limnocylindria bacterium]
MRPDPTDSLADELRRRGLAAPARLLLDAHRPLRPLLSQAGTFLSPLLLPLFGRRAGSLQATLDEPDAYDRLIDRLRGER